MTTNFDDACIRPVVDRCKREINADIAAGRVPATVKTFSKLHDYVDANEYGGACEQDADCAFHSFADSDEATAFWNRVQNEVDRWLKAGRPAPK